MVRVCQQHFSKSVWKMLINLVGIIDGCREEWYNKDEQSPSEFVGIV